MKFNRLLRFFDSGWSLVGFGHSILVQGYISDSVVDGTTFEDIFHFFPDGARSDIILEQDDFIAPVGARVNMLVIPNSRKKEEWAPASPFSTDFTIHRRELFLQCNDLSSFFLRNLGRSYHAFNIFSFRRGIRRWNLEGALLNNIVSPKALKLLTESDNKYVYGVQGVSSKVNALLKPRFQVHLDFFGKNWKVFSAKRKQSMYTTKRYVFWFMGLGKRSRSWHLQYKHKINSKDFYSEARGDAVYVKYSEFLRKIALRQLLKRKRYQVKRRLKNFRRKKTGRSLPLISRGFATSYRSKVKDPRRQKFFRTKRTLFRNKQGYNFRQRKVRQNRNIGLSLSRRVSGPLQATGKFFVNDVSTAEVTRGRFAAFYRKFRKYRRQHTREFFVKLAGDKVNRYIIKGLKLRVGCKVGHRSSSFIRATRHLRLRDQLNFQNKLRFNYVVSKYKIKQQDMDNFVCYSKDKVLLNKLSVRFGRVITKYFIRKRLMAKNLGIILNFMRVRLLRLKVLSKKTLLSRKSKSDAGAVGGRYFFSFFGVSKFFRIARTRYVTLYFARRFRVRSHFFKRWLTRCSLNKVQKSGVQNSRNLWVFMLKNFFVNHRFAGLKAVFVRNGLNDLRRYFCILKSKMLLTVIKRVLTSAGPTPVQEFRTIKYVVNALIKQIKVLIKSWNLLVLAHCSTLELAMLVRDVLVCERQLRVFVVDAFAGVLNYGIKNIYWDFTREGDFRYKLEFKGKSLKPFGFKLTNLMISEDIVSGLSLLKKFELYMVESLLFSLVVRKEWALDFAAENVEHLRLLSARNFSRRSVMRYVRLISQSIYRFMVTDEEDEEQLEEFYRVTKDFKQESSFINSLGDFSFVYLNCKEDQALLDSVEEEDSETLVEEFKDDDASHEYFKINAIFTEKLQTLAVVLKLLTKSNNNFGGVPNLELYRVIGVMDHGSLMERSIRKEWLKLRSLQ